MKSRSLRAALTTPVILTLFGLIVVLGYGTLVALPYIQGPQVTVNEPQNTDAGTVLLSGNTTRVSKLAINELEVPITDTGLFSVERAFPPGYTVVTIVASDRFGRSREKTLTFITPEYHASQKESTRQESPSTGTREGSGTEN